jgi:hypothetical protein
MKYRTLTRDCHCQKITVEDSQVLECDFIRSPKFDLQTQLGHVTADSVTKGRAHGKRHGAKSILLAAIVYASTRARGILVASVSAR